MKITVVTCTCPVGEKNYKALVSRMANEGWIRTSDSMTNEEECLTGQAPAFYEVVFKKLPKPYRQGQRKRPTPFCMTEKKPGPRPNTSRSHMLLGRR